MTLSHKAARWGEMGAALQRPPCPAIDHMPPQARAWAAPGQL